MKRKRRQEKEERKKKQNFSNCRTSALGLSPPFCVASLGVLLSPAVSPACSLCMQQQWQPTGADIFLKQPPGCCVWGHLSSAQLGSTLPPPGIQGQGDCTSAIWTHNFAGLRVSFAAASRSSVPFHCLPPAPPLVPKSSNFNEEQHRFWLSAYPYRCAQSSLLSFPRVLFALVICILMGMPSD